MTPPPRIVLVTSRWGDPWGERDVVAKRVAAALANRGEVQVWIPSARGPAEERDGALRLRRFPAEPPPPSRRIALERVIAVGAPWDRCDCAAALAGALQKVTPAVLQRERLRGDGSDAGAMLDALRAERFDVAVFADLGAASTYFGVQAVGPDTRVALLPFATRSSTWTFPILDSVLARAHAILVLTEGERRRLERRGVERGRIRNVGFALRVHELARRTEPLGPFEEMLVGVARDWRTVPRPSDLRAAAIALLDRVSDVRLCLLGPGTERFAFLPPLNVRHSASVIDIWRWASRSLAMLEPDAGDVLGRFALESMMYGTPVIARDDDGPAREHVEAGDGGLWYRNQGELFAAIERLRDPAIRRGLGEQGRRYALERYGDVDGFVRRVGDAVFGCRPSLEATGAIG